VESVLGLVASNSGIALMMEKVFSYHRHQDVIAIPLKENISSNLVLARLKNTKESRAARTFFNFMEKTLAD
jgi:LysR family transcriptional regulator, transcription activator of glutamate synthase operon